MLRLVGRKADGWLPSLGCSRGTSSAPATSRSTRRRSEPLAGPAEWWVETLAGFMEDGFHTLVFWPVDTAPGQVQLMAGDVAPALHRSG
jgi:hypothetical protein